MDFFIAVLVNGCTKKVHTQIHHLKQPDFTESFELFEGDEQKNSLLLDDKNDDTVAIRLELNDIIGTWIITNSLESMEVEIEFTENGVLFIREGAIEESYPYRIIENQIILADTQKANNFSEFTNFYILPNDIYLYKTDFDGVLDIMIYRHLSNRYILRRSIFLANQNNFQPPTDTIAMPIDFDVVSDFLFVFFGGNDYIILDEPFEMRKGKLFFDINYIGKRFYTKENILDKAVGFEIKGDSFTPYFLIENFRFLDKENNIILDFSESYDGIYGFALYYAKQHPLSPFTSPLSIDTYFDNGVRVADSFILEWNEENMTFERIKQAIH